MAAHRLLLPALLPPLTIVLMMLTAGGLLLTAALLVAPPLPAASTLVRPATVVVPKTDATRTILAQVAQVALPRTPAVVDLARLIYAPGAGGSHRGLLGASLLVVDAGALTVRLGGAAQLLQAERAQPVAAGDLVLQPGDGLLLPRATAATFHNGGTVPAVVLAAGIFPSGGGASRFGRVGLASWAESWSPGATVQPLAGGWIGNTTARAATLTVQRLTLPIDEGLSLNAPGPVDLAVETGVLTLEARGGLVWQQPPQGQDQFIAPPQVVALLPGDAALLQEEADVTLRNDGRGPLVVLALSVELDHDDLITPHDTPRVVATRSSANRHDGTEGSRMGLAHIGTILQGSDPHDALALMSVAARHRDLPRASIPCTYAVVKERRMAPTFDFPAFKRAFEAQDVEAWLAFFAPDAEWWEYRPDAPPRSPIKMVGREAIRAKMTRVVGMELEQTISDEVLGEERVAFAFWVTLPDGRHFIEHVILHLAEGKIARQVDVEMWD